MDFISDTLRGIVVSLSVAGIIAIMKWVFWKIYKNKYKFLLGDWRGYYLSTKEDLLLEQKITVSINWLNRLTIKIVENTAANYKFNGKLKIVGGRLFGRIKGLEHEENAFLAMIVPFNRKNPIPSMNGLFVGVTQENFPAVIKIHWSRSPKSLAQIQEEFGPDPKFLIVKNDTKENLSQKDIEESVKKKLNR